MVRLEPVARVQVAVERQAQVAQDRQEPRVLSRAVVVYRRGLATGGGQDSCGRGGAGNLCPASEGGRVHAQPCQPPCDGIHVALLASMAGTRQGQLDIGKAEGVGGAGGDQRQGLDRLNSRSGHDRAGGVTPCLHDPAGRIDEDDIHLVKALGPPAAGHLHEERPTHAGFTL